MRKAIIILLYLIAVSVTAMAETPYVGVHTREYTPEHPLIYEDAWEKWPYAFLNDDGEPDGFNVRLVRVIMRRLNIPYEIILRSQDDVHNDLKAGRADLSFGVNAGYNSPYGYFGKVTVTTFDNAVAQPRRDSVGPYRLVDLKDYPLSVKKNSRAYHYVIDNGFSDSLINCVDNMEEEVLRIATENKGTILWNAMMLKWLVNKYHLTDIAVSPVDIPSGKYCFMSGDTTLLNKLDSVTVVLHREGVTDNLSTQWMYPEREQTDNTYLYIMVVIAVIVVIVLCIVYGIRHYRKYYSRDTLSDVNTQMNLVLSSNDMQVWVYFPLTRRYAWMTRDGKVNEEYSSFDFSQFYPDQDFNIIHAQVMEFLSRDSEPVTKTLHSYDLNIPGRILDVEVHMQVLKDDYGKIYLICGVQHDITDSKAYLERMRLLHERHKVAFNIALGAILRFDGNGTLVDINDRCCVKMGIKDKKAVLDKKYHFSDFGVFSDFDYRTMRNDIRFTACIRNVDMARYAPIANFDGFNPDPEQHPDFYTKMEIENNQHRVPEMGYYYIHLVKSNDKDGNLISIMMFMLDITENVKEQKALKRMRKHADLLESEKEKYLSRRDYTLRSNDILMVRYRPDTKILTVFDRKNGTKRELSQLSVLEFIDEKDMKSVFKVFHKVDAYERTAIHLKVATQMRNADGERKNYDLNLTPVYDKRGNVESYFGICCDITEQLLIQRNLKHKTMRAREAEHLRQTFLKNMSYSIRQPLVAMRENIRNLSVSKDDAKEKILLNSITNNTTRLITLSDDTLMLSRLEAGLLTLSPETIDFVELYKSVTEETINEFRSENVTYRVENLYESLPVYMDREVLTRILHEAVGLSARYTQYGTVNVRYLFRKDVLTLAVEDTGHGIPPGVLANIYEPTYGSTYGVDTSNYKISGLEMPICKALVELLNGTIEIESEPSKGTSIYIVIPI